MLGKLLKHDFLMTYKTFLIILSAILAAALTTSLTFEKYEAMNIIFSISIGVGIVLAYLYIVQYCKNSIYSKEGYLTNTLPASKAEIISSKLIISMFWINILLLTIAAAFQICHKLDIFTEIFIYFTKSYKNTMGKTDIPQAYFIAIWVLINVYTFCLLTTFIMAVSISQTQLKARINSAAAAVLITAAAVLIQIFAAIAASDIVPIILTVNYDVVSFNTLATIQTWSSFTPQTFNMTAAVVSLIFASIYYFTAVFLTDKKVNI